MASSGWEPEGAASAILFVFRGTHKVVMELTDTEREVVEAYLNVFYYRFNADSRTDSSECGSV